MDNFCGLDFGTSNSSMGFVLDNHIKLTTFNHKTYIPSAIFFEFDVREPLFGEQAIKRYIDGHEGRMIWSPKNALGTNLVFEKTFIENKSVTFKEIISLIINNIKIHAESQSKKSLQNIVVGRPVFYNDKDKKLDSDAQDAMHEILQDLGFKEIAFEYEPIAAAFHYEQSISGEEIVLVVDMGGGTSDFTVAKLSKREGVRAQKILAIGGIHVAGTNFDRRLSLKSLMPELGLGARYKTLEGKWAQVPPTLHKDLATWHKIGFCYNKNNNAFAKQKIYTSAVPEKFERLLQVLEQRLGHNLAIAVEKAKISLSDKEATSIFIDGLKPVIDKPITINDLEEAIQGEVEKIITTLKKVIADADIEKNRVSAIFMTGGASMVPIVRKSVLSYLPNAKLIDGDKFGSVASGLTTLAQMKFSTIKG